MLQVCRNQCRYFQRIQVIGQLNTGFCRKRSVHNTAEWGNLLQTLKFFQCSGSDTCAEQLADLLVFTHRIQSRFNPIDFCFIKIKRFLFQQFSIHHLTLSDFLIFVLYSEYICRVYYLRIILCEIMQLAVPDEKTVFY